MRVLFDTNVVLDVLLARAPHIGPPTALLDQVAANDLEGLLGATTLTTIQYLAAKAVRAKQAERHLRTLLSLFEVGACDACRADRCAGARVSRLRGCRLARGARHAGAAAIVTRDPKGFPKARLKVYAPDELLRFIQATPQS